MPRFGQWVKSWLPEITSFVVSTFSDESHKPFADRVPTLRTINIRPKDEIHGV
jgi:hypothetical protein